jgi:ectoine hydroxylase-related dioxygenase (phytanoyl-CoA dioxygenase family)
MRRLQHELAELRDAEYRGDKDSFAGEQTARNGGYVLSNCPSSQELLTHPTVLTAVKSILLASCRRIRLAVASSIRIEGGQPPQVLHRDDTEWPVDLLATIKPGTELEVSAMWAVTDFTAPNGATCVVPGSHLWERSRPLTSHPCQACMRCGSVLIYTGSVIHGGGPSSLKRTEAGRQGLLGSYVLGWLHPEFNFHFTMPIATMAEMSSEMRDLLGFTGENRYKYKDSVGPAYATGN